MPRSLTMFAALSAATLSAGVLLASPASASDVGTTVTYEWDNAVAGSPPSGLPCVSTTGAVACFEAYGDRWWVKDTASDSASAVANWENYLSGSLYRSGGCRNGLGSGTWGYCNKDYYEDSTLVYSACVYDASSGVWVRCS